MRHHARFARLAPRYDVEAFALNVRPEYLVAARLDPGFSGHPEGNGLLDLVFARDNRFVVIPFIMVVSSALMSRQESPYVWPAWLPPIRSSVVRELEEVVEPWLRSLTLARFADAEAIRRFTDDPQQQRVYDAARVYGFLGAAPTETAMRALAPYVYALRFAARKRIAIVDPHGASGAAMLARVAAGVTVDLQDDERMRVAHQWFGLDIFAATTRPAEADVAIGAREHLANAPVRLVLDDDAQSGERGIGVAHPIPPSVMVSFDLEDGAQARRFAVTAPSASPRPSTLAETKIVGGSAGRIGIVVRDDYLVADDADIDAARALAFRLEEQGFDPVVVGASQVASSTYDALHLIGLDGCDALRERVESAAPGIPVVVMPLGGCHDSPPSEAMRSVLARAWGAVVACAEEERRVRETLGFRGVTQVVPALLSPEPEPARVGSLVGTAPFILLHAPLERRFNHLTLVRAAGALGHPIVLVGNATDVEYYHDVVASFGDGGIWLPNDSLEPPELAALYAQARVFAGLSSGERGLYRLSRAGAFGAALVAPATSCARHCWPGLVQTIDSGSYESTLAGLKTAWDRAEELGAATASRIAQQCDPFAGLVSILATYQPAAVR
jgi:hypothetical protein